uniref:ATP synthase subunit a n=1 Tax=Macaca fascicularis aureus TaxID=1747270 RepID=A0A3T0WUH8_MACFA|nr:ATP synthase F0 subunit 6 [Macaca fascicularis aureus]WDA96305.1 ATP synthase F0 subunit 6 [Macaca fascicularis aureus]BBB02567.1 ATP synthase F0 subunit 6 [Macaca fascicularis aureus]BCD69043.1 ATP synthase F0 subunit 6 [Macaca fascicularis aureus]BCD69056.1 ATP synthase F0 subunit 6 [Macaca fascicularis aureus]
MNENLFTSFSAPTILNQPATIPIILFPTLLILTSKHPTNNRLATIQQNLTQFTLKQMMTTHNAKGQTWSLMLMSLITFIAMTNLLGLLPYSFTPTTQLSMNLAMAIPLWAGTVVLGLRFKTKNSLAHLLPQGTPTPLIPMLVVIETISLLIQPMALAVRLTANITAGHLLMHLIGSAMLTLSTTNFSMTLLTSMLLALLTILEIAVALIQAYVFTLLISLYLYNNT